MTLAQFPELSKCQPMKLAEELWFSGVDDRQPINPAHKEVLDASQAAEESGKTKRLTLPEQERRLVRS